MPTVLVTGAGRGLGLEFARQYAADGWRVIATVRDLKKAKELGVLGSKVEIHGLDVTDLKAVAALGRELARDTIDVAIANAGVSLARNMTPGAIDEAAWIDTLKVNTFAPLALAGAVLGSVERSEGKRLVAITSRLGSIGANDAGGQYAYRSSKAALNAAWRSLALDHRGVIAVVLHPGWVKTDMGGAGAPVSPKESIAGMRRVIAKLTPADSGRFFNYDGAEIPW
ncbi:MAG TPA: SDR family oxidoreductase [Stellaceae bacterium]|nr:SDR family oxidoreductase [Stellaceae bacterium]